MEPGEAQELECEVVLLGGKTLGRAESGARDRQDSLAVGGGRFDLRRELDTRVGVEMAQIRDRLGCTLGGDDVVREGG